MVLLNSPFIFAIPHIFNKHTCYKITDGISVLQELQLKHNFSQTDSPELKNGMPILKAAIQDSEVKLCPRSQNVF